MLAFKKGNSRGDTLIEVLFAITIFSSVAVASISIMNQGVTVAQRALEITLVRQEIDSQAETLRYLNAAYISAYQPTATASSYTGPAAQWKSIRDNNLLTTVSSFGSSATCGTPQARSFILNTNNATAISLNGANYAVPSTFSQVRYNAVGAFTSADGIWIEAIHSVASVDAFQSDAGYIDFHIRACWTSAGQSAPLTIGTIVRLYEPI